MFKLNSRIKLFITMIIFGIFAGWMFLYGYGIMENKNLTKLDSVNKKNLEIEVLKKEQLTYEHGKKYIATLSEKPFPPQDLFSKDTKVVKEIRTLEDLAKKYGLEFTLEVSGTTKTAVKATDVGGDLLQVPYTVNVEGPYNNIQKYVEAAEHTAFINQTQSLAIVALEGGKSKASLVSVFYLKP